MSKTGSASKIKLNGFDALFGTEDVQAKDSDQVVEVELQELYEFQGHPFLVTDDEKMMEMAESIRAYGVLVPGVVRPRSKGGYEILAGHRRKHGCELAGLKTMPVCIRNYNDNEATIIMVDSNIQREDILPSEKAKAYAMKYEAMKHQGKRTGIGRTLDIVGKTAGESGKTVQRYISLSKLSDFLLTMVDKKKLGLMQGVDISFLSLEEQEWVEQIMEETGVTVSSEQSARLKELSGKKELTKSMVTLLLTQEKKKERNITLKGEHIRQYFPSEYSKEEIQAIIMQLLEDWNRKKQEVER